MALPAKERNWEVAPNILTCSDTASESLGQLLFDIKDTMVSWTNGAASVYRSSDGDTQYGAADYWATAADVKYGINSVGAWIVLDLASGGQWLMGRAGGAAPYYGRLAYSEGGLYTGGDLDNYPTATDEYLWDAQYLFNISSAGRKYLTMLHSEDGETDAWFTFVGGAVESYYFMSRLENCVDGWDDSRIHHYPQNGSPTYAILYATQVIRFLQDGTYYTGSLGFPGWQEFAIGDVLPTNEITGRCPFSPAAFASFTSPVRGVHGRLVDIFGSSDTFSSGDFLEEDVDNPTFEWIQIGDFIWPWDGETSELLMSV